MQHVPCAADPRCKGFPGASASVASQLSKALPLGSERHGRGEPWNLQVFAPHACISTGAGDAAMSKTQILVLREAANLDSESHRMPRK